MEAGGSVDDILEKWYRKFSKIPKDLHLLCPRISDDDLEDYDKPDPQYSNISPEEKRRRQQAAEERFEIVAWTSLIFGYDKTKAGIWLEKFSSRMEHCLQTCEKCVLSWHMGRNKIKTTISE